MTIPVSKFAQDTAPSKLHTRNIKRVDLLILVTYQQRFDTDLFCVFYFTESQTVIALCFVTFFPAQCVQISEVLNKRTVMVKISLKTILRYFPYLPIIPVTFYQALSANIHKRVVLDNQ